MDSLYLGASRLLQNMDQIRSQRPAVNCIYLPPCYWDLTWWRTSPENKPHGHLLASGLPLEHVDCFLLASC